MLRQTVLLLYFATSGALSQPLTPTHSKQQTLSIRVQPLSDQKDRRRLWQTLSRVAPSTLQVEAGQTIESAIRTKCGNAPADLKEKLLALNPGVDVGVTQEKRALRFLSCPFWYFGRQLTSDSSSQNLPVIQVREGENLGALLTNFMGTAGDKTVEDVQRLNPGAISLDKKFISRTGALRLPYIAKPLRVDLQESGSEAPAIAADVSKGLPKKNQSTVRSNVSETEYQLVASVDAEISDPKVQCHAPDDVEKMWPVNLEEVREAIQRTRSLIPAEAMSPSFASVAVADTGLRSDEAALIKRLWNNPRITGGITQATAVFTDDLHGASMSLRRGRAEDILAPSEYKYSTHGSQVARVIIESGIRSAELDGLINVAILKLNEPHAPYPIRIDSVPVALDYARIIQSAVVNLSVVTGAQASSLDTAVAASYGLVVVAAGNDRDFPESLGLFPPALANNRHKFIVVGAHDWAGKLAPFSNKGDLVDILAPGCSIPLSDPQTGKSRLVSGTSFAAPLVSSAAAFLISVGFPSDPYLLQSRILGAGRFDPELQGLTKYGVRLDTARAIRYREDSFLPRGAERPKYGNMEDTHSFVCQTAAGIKSFLRKDVVKIVISDQDHPSVWTHPRSPGPVQISRCIGHFLTGSFTFRESGESSSRTISWSDVDDLVLTFTQNVR